MLNIYMSSPGYTEIQKKSQKTQKKVKKYLTPYDICNTYNISKNTTNKT